MYSSKPSKNTVEVSSPVTERRGSGILNCAVWERPRKNLSSVHVSRLVTVIGMADASGAASMDIRKPVATMSFASILGSIRACVQRNLNRNP